MKTKLIGLVTEEEGQGMTEYGLIIALVAILLIVALGAFRGQIAGVFTRSGTQLDGVAP